LISFRSLNCEPKITNSRRSIKNSKRMRKYRDINNLDLCLLPGLYLNPLSSRRRVFASLSVRRVTSSRDKLSVLSPWKVQV
jgi:hypothetical protein